MHTSLNFNQFDLIKSNLLQYYPHINSSKTINNQQQEEEVECYFILQALDTFYNVRTNIYAGLPTTSHSTHETLSHKSKLNYIS